MEANRHGEMLRFIAWTAGDSTRSAPGLSRNWPRSTSARAAHLAYAPTLDLGAHFVSHKAGERNAWLHGVFPDVFDPEFDSFVAADARRQIGDHAQDSQVLGWFTDNELRWGPDWRAKDEMLVAFLNLPAGTPGRNAAMVLIRARHADIASLNSAWGTRFADWTALERAEGTQVALSRRPAAGQNQETSRAAGGEAFFADCDAFLAQLAERYFHATDAPPTTRRPRHASGNNRR